MPPTGFLVSNAWTTVLRRPVTLSPNDSGLCTRASATAGGTWIVINSSPSGFMSRSASPNSATTPARSPSRTSGLRAGTVASTLLTACAVRVSPSSAASMLA